MRRTMPIASRMTKTMRQSEKLRTQPPRIGERTGAMPLMAPMSAMTVASALPLQRSVAMLRERTTPPDAPRP